MRILLIEDDEDLGPSIKQGLEANTFAVDLADTGTQGLQLARLNDYDAAVLDLGLPDMTGAELAAELRKFKRSLPIIALTGKFVDTSSEVNALESCDDFIRKQSGFTIDALVARIRALLRRGETQHDAVLQVVDLVLDPRRGTVTRGGKLLELRNKEFALLEYFMRHAGDICSRNTLLEHVWDINADPLTKTVDATMQRLRRKVDGGHKRKLLHTVQGRGYRLASHEHAGVDYTKQDFQKTLDP